MPNDILRFAGMQADEQTEIANGKGSSGTIFPINKDGSNSTCAVDRNSLTIGVNSLEVDPVNGQPVTDRYGGQLSLGSNPRFLVVTFAWRFAAEFDSNVVICELSRDASARDRRIVITTAEELVIQDKDDDNVGGVGGSSTLAVNTTYPMYWYIDLLGTTRDILWVWISGAWSKEIDVSGHGVFDFSTSSRRVTFGSDTGKSLPTIGGKMYYGGMCVTENPIVGGLGSIATKFLPANGNGADTGEWDDHAFGDVDEVPADLDGTTVDKASTAGDKQSYDFVNPGETPLAMQVVGVAKTSTGANTAKAYTFDGTNRDYQETKPYGNANRFISLRTTELPKTTMPDGSAITESGVNSMEVGMELVTVDTTGTLDLDQIGLEEMVAGAQSQPSDFPTDVGTGVEVLGPTLIT